MEWTRDNVLHFIEELKQYNCLWQVTSSSYRNRTLRADSIKKLVEEMKVNMPEITCHAVKEKIRTLKDQYT